MKIRYLSRVAAVLALALTTQISGAGVLTLSGGINSGGTITGVSIDSAGNVTVTGTPAGGTGGTGGSGGLLLGVPVCSLGASATAISPTQTSTLTANCTNSPASYAWTGGPPTASGSSATLAFPSVGSFTYTVTGTNGSGAGAASNSVTVNVTSSTPPPGNCPAVPAGLRVTNYTVAWTPQGTTGKKLYPIQQNEIAALKFTADGPNPSRSGQLSWVPNNTVSSNSVIVNISKCPGDFSQTGIPLTYLCRGEGGYSTLFYTQNSTSDYQCPIATGDYYINIRSGNRTSGSPIDPSYTITDNCPAGATCGVTVEFK
ncbi:MAG: PKD domain-containing protein [Gammaproteobacteria bacterium]|nr:PKD domain-containing protein [Gammaproteobacteria bacterium]